MTATLADVRAGSTRCCRRGTQGPDRFHRRLGEILYAGCGVTRSAQGLTDAIVAIDGLTAEFWADLRVAGRGTQFNQELEEAGRVGDFLGLARLMCFDARDRDESCGAHFRVERRLPTVRLNATTSAGASSRRGNAVVMGRRSDMRKH